MSDWFNETVRVIREAEAEHREPSFIPIEESIAESNQRRGLLKLDYYRAGQRKHLVKDIKINKLK